MRTNDILRVLRRLPPKVQLGLGAVAVVAFGVMWLTGTLPQELTGNSFVNERQDSTQTRTTASRPQNSDRQSTGGARKAERTSGQSRSRNTASNTRNVDGGTGDYDYLSLALSWSPTYCETAGRGRNDQQCSGNRAFAFVVHGLWPQYNKGWPENCARGRNPRVPNDVIRSMLDIMPSRGLIIHEYKKHGTCAGLDAKGYFSLTRELYRKIRIPPRYVRPAKVIRTSPREVENDFLKANPGMSADMISIVCGRGERLKELRICFSKDGDLTRCGRNESQKKLCSRGSIRVPPVRSRRRG